MDTNLSAFAGGISADGLGTVFVAGYRTSEGIAYGVIRQSTNQGDSWEPAEEELEGAKYQSITSRGATTVAAARFYGACLVRGTEDGGATWDDRTLYMHPDPDYAIETIWDVELDASGNIYVVTTYLETVANIVVEGKGKNATTTTYYTHPRRYVILKYNQGSNEWSPIQSTLPITKIVSYGADVYCIGNTYWNVRKSSNGGIDWVTLDSWQLDMDARSDASDIAIDGSGKLYVTGMGSRRIDRRKGRGYDYPRYWIVRHQTDSADGTRTWKTDELRYGLVSRYNQAAAVTVDKDNNVHVVGTIGTDVPVNTTGWYQRWLTREYSPDPETSVWSWKDSDLVDQVSWGYGAFGSRITADPSGNVFAKGGIPYNSPYEGLGWTLRRKLASPAP